MSDWQVGDKAVCVVRGVIRCPSTPCFVHEGALLPSSASILDVVVVEKDRDALGECGCIALTLSDGSRGISARFRKVLPDKHEACEEEFVTLLKRKPVEHIIGCDGDD